MTSSTPKGDCRHENAEGNVWILYDARGIPVRKVCDECVDAVKAKYRPEIFTNSNYWHDEPLWEDSV